MENITWMKQVNERVFIIKINNMVVAICELM